MKKENAQNIGFSLMSEWIIVLADFFVENGFVEMKLVRSEVNKYIKAGEHKGIETAFFEINDLTTDLPSKEKEELNRRLKARFGKTLYDMNKQHQKRIDSIIKRGTIRNDDEFRRVQSHIENIWQNPNCKQEFETLQELNFSYEQAK